MHRGITAGAAGIVYRGVEREAAEVIPRQRIVDAAVCGSQIHRVKVTRAADIKDRRVRARGIMGKRELAEQVPAAGKPVDLARVIQHENTAVAAEAEILRAREGIRQAGEIRQRKIIRTPDLAEAIEQIKFPIGRDLHLFGDLIEPGEGHGPLVRRRDADSIKRSLIISVSGRNVPVSRIAGPERDVGGRTWAHSQPPKTPNLGPALAASRRGPHLVQREDHDIALRAADIGDKRVARRQGHDRGGREVDLRTARQGGAGKKAE